MGMLDGECCHDVDGMTVDTRWSIWCMVC